jgi:hypothetical protein
MIMKNVKLLLATVGFIFLTLVFLNCQRDEILTNENADYQTSVENTVREETTVGNNLSFPVIWSDGYEKVLREPRDPSVANLKGEWWHVWNLDPAEPTDMVYSCLPNPSNPIYCEDGSNPGEGTVSKIYRAYLQKDAKNIWQADNFSATSPLKVDLIDWGDNLESIDWSLRSQVRTEIVLYENLWEPVREYAMRHVYGWGIDEMHGLKTNDGGQVLYGPGNQATVYSHNARLTFQKLNVDKDDIIPGSLTWVPNEGWTETIPTGENIINAPIFNMAVYEAEDGPGFYNAEINVKGKIIYGYTWNVKKLNEGVGYYRITFSLDEFGGVVPLNTFIDSETEIILPVEELSSLYTREEGEKGGVAIIDVDNNLTYMDILIVEKIGGGGTGGGGGGGGGH